MIYDRNLSKLADDTRALVNGESTQMIMASPMVAAIANQIEAMGVIERSNQELQNRFSFYAKTQIIVALISLVFAYGSINHIEDNSPGYGIFIIGIILSIFWISVHPLYEWITKNKYKKIK